MLSGSALPSFPWPLTVSEIQLQGRSLSLSRQGLTLLTGLGPDPSQGNSGLHMVLCDPDNRGSSGWSQVRVSDLPWHPRSGREEPEALGVLGKLGAVTVGVLGREL